MSPARSFVGQVITGALGASCSATRGCSYRFLSWTASTTPSVNYNIYRATTSGGYTTPLNSVPDPWHNLFGLQRHAGPDVLLRNPVRGQHRHGKCQFRRSRRNYTFHLRLCASSSLLRNGWAWLRFCRFHPLNPQGWSAFAHFSRALALASATNRESVPMVFICRNPSATLCHFPRPERY